MSNKTAVSTIKCLMVLSILTPGSLFAASLQNAQENAQFQEWQKNKDSALNSLFQVVPGGAKSLMVTASNIMPPNQKELLAGMRRLTSFFTKLKYPSLNGFSILELTLFPVSRVYQAPSGEKALSLSLSQYDEDWLKYFSSEPNSEVSFRKSLADAKDALTSDAEYTVTKKLAISTCESATDKTAPFQFSSGLSKDDEHFIFNFETESDFAGTKNSTAELRVKDSSQMGYHTKLSLFLDDRCEVLGGTSTTLSDPSRSLMVLDEKTFDKNGKIVFLKARNPPVPTQILSQVVPNAARVAVIDSGVDYRRKDVFPYLALTPKHELIGWDFTDRDPLPFDDETILSRGFDDSNFHGTATSLLVSQQFKGIEVVPIKGLYNVDKAIDFAASSGARVINLSIGNNDCETFEKKLTEYPDILFVTAAGNERRNLDYPNSNWCPASLLAPNLITVGAVNEKSQYATYFSNYGAGHVDLAAPGVDILLPFARGEWSPRSGTSFSAPQVSHVAGKILFQAPHLSPAQVKSLITSTVTEHAELCRYVKTCGILNEEAALHKLSAQN